MQSVIDKIKKIDTILKEFKDDVEYSFWCPRDFTNPQGKGFTLYIYGGHVLDIFVDEAKNIYCKAFDKEYFPFFNEDRDEIEKAFLHLANCHSVNNIDVVLKWNTEIWKIIFKALKNRAENIDVQKNDKVYLERMRENAIVHKCSPIVKKGDDILMAVNIEASIISSRGKVKPDMITIRMRKKIPIISYIEYKCTEGGIDGTDLKTHFEDMQSYYKDSSLVEKIKDYFERIMQLQGSNIDGIRWQHCKQEIVFLFSNVVKETKDTKRELPISTIVSHIRKMEKSEVFPQNNVKADFIKFWIIKDEKSSIQNRKEFTYNELKVAVDEIMSKYFWV